MKLRFIGADGSMGLKHGEVYGVNLGNTQAFITVYWMDEEGYVTPCYYSSPKAFAKNWEAV
jgi:hypothetical protein